MIDRKVPAVLARATPTAGRLRSLFSTQRWMRALRILAPSLITVIFSAAAHAQGTMDFSGAQTLMGTFNVGTGAIQSQVVLAHPSKVVTEQPVHPIERQAVYLCDFEERLEGRVFAGTRQIR